MIIKSPRDGQDYIIDTPYHYLIVDMLSHKAIEGNPRQAIFYYVTDIVGYGTLYSTWSHNVFISTNSFPNDITNVHYKHISHEYYP